MKKTKKSPKKKASRGGMKYVTFDAGKQRKDEVVPLLDPSKARKYPDLR